MLIITKVTRLTKPNNKTIEHFLYLAENPWKNPPIRKKLNSLKYSKFLNY